MSAARLPMVHDGLDRVDGGEHPLPRREEQGRKRWVGEEELGVRQGQRVEVGREDVPAAEAKVDPEVDLIGAERQEESVAQCGREGDHRRSPAGDPARQAPGSSEDRRATLEGLIDGCHRSSAEPESRSLTVPHGDDRMRIGSSLGPACPTRSALNSRRHRVARERRVHAIRGEAEAPMHARPGFPQGYDWGPAAAAS